ARDRLAGRERRVPLRVRDDVLRARFGKDELAVLPDSRRVEPAGPAAPLEEELAQGLALARGRAVTDLEQPSAVGALRVGRGAGGLALAAGEALPGRPSAPEGRSA